MSKRPQFPDGVEVSEAALHRAVADHLRATLEPPIMWTTLDAGAGKMRARTARQRKNRGVKPGWPDILIIAPGSKILGIELKAKKGTQDPDQVAVEGAFELCGAAYVVCRSVQEVCNAIQINLRRLDRPRISSPLSPVFTAPSRIGL
jgi:hypothetical protein